MKSTQQGFTLMELMIVVVGVRDIALAITGVWVVVHFLSKFW